VPRSSRAPISLAAISATARSVPAVQDRIVHEVPVGDVRPSPRNPPHQTGGIDELADSIGTHGLLQPVVVRVVAGAYELIAGHRRLAAVKRLGWSKVPAVVRDEDQADAYILTLVENLQREDLSPKEEAAALEVLMRERGWTTRQVGEAIKRSHMYVSRRLRVFEDVVLAPLVLKNRLAVSTAEELLRAPDPAIRKELAEHAADERWTLGETRRAVSDFGTDRSKWATVASHLRGIVANAAEIDAETLSAADRKLVRRAVTSLRRIV